jgi:hypothetical protein
MKETFNPGDKVEFIDDSQEGVVISVIDQTTVLVSIEDGLEIPVKKNQLIRISKASSQSKSLTDKYAGLEQKLKPKKTSPDQLKHIFLAITGGSEEALKKLYLVNDSPWTLYFTVFSEKNGSFTGISNGKIEDGGFQIITSLNSNDVEKNADFHLYILRYIDDTPETLPPLSFNLKVHQKMFLKETHHVEILDKRCIIYEVYSSKKKKEKLIVATPEKKQEVKKVKKPEDVVDLHIEKINQNHSIMSRNEIFDFQYNHFLNSLEKAIAFNYEKIVFVHGIGVQTLKNKIIDHLKTNKNVKSFKDAEIRKFGYGATEVLLKNERVFKI